MLWWHCYPPKAPNRPNPGPIDLEIYAFDFCHTGFDQQTFSPGYDRSAHRNTWEQGLGQTHHKIPSVSTQRGRFPPPSVDGIAIHEGVTLRSRLPGVCACHHNPWNNLMDVDIKFVLIGQGMKNIQKIQNKRVFSVNLKQTWFKFVQIWNIV